MIYKTVEIYQVKQNIDQWKNNVKPKVLFPLGQYSPGVFFQDNLF